MSYIGSTPTTQSFIAGTDYFNGDGSTVAFTLSRSVVSVNDIEAVINNVEQQPNTAYTVSGTTITFTSAPSAGTGNIYVRYLSTTTQAITPSQGTVSYQTMDSNMQAKQGISFKNRIINGAMVIDQRNAGAAVTANGAYPVDRFLVPNSTDGAYSAQQDSSAPVGFVNSLKVTTTTADTSLITTQQLYLQQRIEGYNVADLGWGTVNAKTVTLSFWVRSSLTGTFGGALRNSDATRSYAFSYTISTADTWEQKSVTVTGDTSGTWLTTNGIGILLSFGLGAGPDRSGTAGAWASAAYSSATGAVSLIGTLNATWYVTGVQLEVGTQATTFDYRSIGTELQLCQRYYETSYAYGTAPGAATQVGMIWTSQSQYTTTSYIGMSYTWKVQKRTTPTIVSYDKAGTSGVLTRWTLGGSETDGSNYSLSGSSDMTWNLYSSGSSNSAGLKLQFTASAEL